MSRPDRLVASRSLPPKRAWLIGGGALVLVLVGYQQFNSGRAAAAHKHAAPAGAPVRVGVVTQRDMAVVERSVGTVVANTTVQVIPVVSGTLEKQAFREGDFVQKGQLLFEIDSRRQTGLGMRLTNFATDV